jgi:hypothetical protein
MALTTDEQFVSAQDVMLGKYVRLKNEMVSCALFLLRREFSVASLIPV